MSDVVHIVDGDGVVGDLTGGTPVPPENLLPVPAAGDLSGGGVVIRGAVEGDLAFIDGLQKANTAAVGFMPTAQLRGHIEQGHVLVAEAMGGGEGCGLRREEGAASGPGTPQDSGLRTSPATPVGYCIGVDKYFKREDVGVIYQMNVVPGRRRGLVGAALLRAQFERSAYGVKLYCCWCAQDLAANRFWEAMGFVPLAFRTGSRKKSWKGEDGERRTGPRIHVFWQKRIRFGDEVTPWWYPSQTGSGAIREDRLVLPIPPGTGWADAKPAVLPGVAGLFGEVAAEREEALKQIAPGTGASGEGRGVSAEAKAARKAARAAKRDAAKQARVEAASRAGSVASGGLRFGPPEEASPQEGSASSGKADAAKRARKAAEQAARKRVAQKNDPRLVAMARELRDRWQEHVSPGSELAGMIEGRARGKYAVGRLIETSATAPGTVPAPGNVPAPPTLEVVAEVKRLEAA